MELLTGPNLAALLTLPGVGEKRALALAHRFGDWQRFLGADLDEFVDELGVKTGTQAAQARTGAPPVPVLPSGVEVVSIHDPHYPARLRTIADPPVLLWWKGTLPADTPSLAVVGTRSPNAFGARVATYAAEQAAAHGINSCSGLALGVDSLGHEGSLNRGRPTWAVLGQGIDTLPGSGDRAVLARRIVAEGGGLLSEVPPGTPVAAHLLVRRNRLQSALSEATFIAQTGLATGPKPAGTLHTARFALEQGRLLAVAVPPQTLAEEPGLAGNMALTCEAGLDPALLHATAPPTVQMVSSRRPVADFAIRQAADFDALWAAIL